MKPKILITGGAGYVGTSLVSQLLAQDYNVRVFDNLMYGGNQLLHFIEHKNFEFQKGDIRDIESVKKAVKDQDIIIHLAAIVGYPACRKNPELAEQVNVLGTKNLIAATSNEQFILYASTGSNYGAVDDVCDENTPLNPLSLYGQTKTLAEAMLLERKNVITYRFATAFGVSPRMRLDLLINEFTHKAFTEGYIVVYEKNFKRTFIHVHDMGRAFIFGINHMDKMKNDVFNVGSDTMNYTKEEICNLLKSKIDLYIHYAEVGKDMDKRNYSVSHKKINNLGYQTTITINEGIDGLIEAFKILNTNNQYSNV